jgi:cystathionine gamma-synthase
MSLHPTSPVTRSVRAGIACDLHHGAVVPPIHLSATFAFEGFDQKRIHDYTRTSNPTRDHLAEAVAELEGGAGAVVTSTGMSAVLLVLQLVEPGGLVIAPHDCYGGTQRLLNALAQRGHFEVSFRNLTIAEPLRNLPRSPSLVLVETPSNPLLRITDVRAVAAEAHALGAIVVADNTFLSPALQQPLALGADIVVHSTTKYLNGHSDVVGGCVVAADETVAQQLAWWANCLGITGAPFDSFLTLRGIRTLFPRMAAHVHNAQAVAAALCAHEAVERVYYPGLPGHPGHDVAALQQRAFGAMLSFELRGGVDGVRRFVEHLRCFTLAESLGGVESLVAHPATMTHASMTAEARAAAGIRDNLVRLSIGIESASDLVDDLRHALDQVQLISGRGSHLPDAAERNSASSTIILATESSSVMGTSPSPRTARENASACKVN